MILVHLFYAAFVGGLLWFHVRASERWDAERARLLAAITAPTPIAAHAALAAQAPAPARRDEPPPPRPRAIGNGGL